MDIPNYINSNAFQVRVAIENGGLQDWHLADLQQIATALGGMQNVARIPTLNAGPVPEPAAHRALGEVTMMLRVMPCGPCRGVSETLPEFKPCSTCDRRAPGYAESESVGYEDAEPGVFPRLPIKPEARMWDPFPGQRAAEAICTNYLHPLEESIKAAEENLCRALLIKAVRHVVTRQPARESKPSAEGLEW